MHGVFRYTTRGHKAVKKICYLLLFVLFLCSAAGAKQVTLTYLMYVHHGNAYHQHIQDKAQAFERLNPGVKIDVIIGDHGKFDTMKMGGVAPDIFDLPDYAHLGPLGELVDLKPLLQRDGLLKAYNPTVLESISSASGAIYTAPLYLSIAPTYFNRDLFAKAGLVTPDQLGTTWNWDTLFSYAKKLTVDADGDGTPESYGLDRPWGATWQHFVKQAGGVFYEFDQFMQPLKSKWNTPQVEQGVEFTTRFYREGLTPHLRPGVDQTAFYFWKGGTAINLGDALTIIGVYLKDAPLEWDVALQPRGPQGPATSVGCAGPNILSSTEYIAEAWAFTKYLVANRENAEDFSRATGLLAALLSAQTAYPVVAGIRDKNVAAIFEQTLYPGPRSIGVLTRDLSPRYIDMTPVWSGRVPVRTHLEQIHSQTTAIIEQTRAR
jgi:ABC-type glycerol-3-phosphate transport system substrate-binding protein